MGAHFACGAVNDEDGSGNTGADGECAVPRQGFERCLQVAGQRGGRHGSGRHLPCDAFGHMRGEDREGKATPGRLLGGGGLCLVVVDEAVPVEARDDAVARRGGGLGEAVRPARLRCLRQGNEQRALGGGKPLRLLAEIGEGGRTGALDVAAIGCERQIEAEDLLLGEAALDLQCTDHFRQLVGEAALRARLQQACHLHGERRSAGDDAAVGGGLPCGAQQRLRVHAAVREEALVLIGDEHGEEARVNLVRGDGQAPVAVPGDEGAQQLAVPVSHQR